MAKLGQFAEALEKEELTREAIIRIALTHLLEQGVRSVDGVECVYGGYNGICCGAGPFIKDYTPSMEGKDWSSIKHTLYQANTIRAVQVLHDNYEPSEWIAKFKERFPDVDFSFIENVKIHENCRSKI